MNADLGMQGIGRKKAQKGEEIIWFVTFAIFCGDDFDVCPVVACNRSNFTLQGCGGVCNIAVWTLLFAW